LEYKNLKLVQEAFELSIPTIKKYLNMSEDEIIALDNPKNYKKRKTMFDDYMNMMYKMLLDEIEPTLIISYVIKNGYSGNVETLTDYLRRVIANNFTGKLTKIYLYKEVLPKDVIRITRSEILKYITTKDVKKIKNKKVATNIELIKNEFPIIEELQLIYDHFHEIVMGDNPDSMDGFVEKNEGGVISSFINGLKKDIAAVKNAISYEESSGFVEGNNNKFKLIKRTLYGRANLKTLFAKGFFAFKVKDSNFDIRQIIKTTIRR
jgi:hypothetical protein